MGSSFFRYIWVVMSCFLGYCAFGQFAIKGSVSNSDMQLLPGVFVFLQPNNVSTTTLKKGEFKFSNLKNGRYEVLVDAVGFKSQQLTIEIDNNDVELKVSLDSLNIFFEQKVVVNSEDYYLNPAVSGVTLLSAKTIHIIDLKKSLSNLSNNNARELFKTVPGLNIWENDNSGIQLNIGGRGLNPNRTSNFNTRQNGYDISADALGYPETYYTPPAQSLQRIEVLRGAASLQFGTQFGGVVNFVMKQGPRDKKFEFVSENTYGGFNFFNTFNSIGGTVAKGKLNYFAFYQFKRGDGWRPNANFDVHNGYLQLEYRPSEKVSVRAEQTIMQYLAHQPGGLTDLEYSINPRQSKRARNWFRVDWNISALTIDIDISSRTKINCRNFALYASRQSLGNLQSINRPDYGNARDLIKGNYLNFGNETRLIHRYTIKDRTSALVTGVRFYRGHTNQQQGYSNSDTTGYLSDFEFVEPAQGILQSDFVFPSFNFAFFAENFFSISDKFSITPGIRFEYIHTEASGYYQDLVTVSTATGIDTIRNEAVSEQRSLGRPLFLAGLGISYKLNKNMELYWNCSQNYRGINFNDMRISNPNQVVDPELKDEYGFNADIGFRGSYKGLFNFNATLFYLGYNRRIGNIQSERPNIDNPLIIEPYTLRTNVGNARVFGIEVYAEADLWKMIAGPKSDFSFSLFSNFSLLDGRYTKTQNSYAQGKQLEFVAPFILRTGIGFGYKSFKFSYQYSYTSKHYSDATNAETVPNAVVGVIPSYGVMDVSASYQLKWFTFQAGINNLSDEVYFTRRATSYPGPGILPADGISFYITLRVQLSTP